MYKIIVNQKLENVSERFDVIQAQRIDRSSDSLFKKVSASYYYKLIKKMTGIDLVHNGADYRIMTREVVDHLLELPEQNRIYRLLIPKLGFSIRPYPVIRNERFAGSTKYTLKKMIKLSLDSLFAFTFKPLRLFAYIGILSSVVFFLAFIITLIFSITFQTVPGWPSVVLLILSANAFLFAGLGILGEYIGRLYELVQARPIAIWTEISNEKK
jgi:dolichol-phosphate mannosyltransferase